jgi:hypothetical protein
MHRFSIGRDEKCDVVLHGASVSRQHAYLILRVTGVSSSRMQTAPTAPIWSKATSLSASARRTFSRRHACS